MREARLVRLESLAHAFATLDVLGEIGNRRAHRPGCCDGLHRETRTGLVRAMEQIEVVRLGSFVDERFELGKGRWHGDADRGERLRGRFRRRPAPECSGDQVEKDGT